MRRPDVYGNVPIMTTSKHAGHLTISENIRIDEELRDALDEMSREGDRTRAQEVRRALREHVRIWKEKRTQQP